IETEDKAAVDLDAVLTQDRYPAGVILRPRGFLPRRCQVIVRERLKSDKDPSAARQGHRTHQGRVVGYVERHGRPPDFLQRLQGTTQLPQVGGLGSEVIVNKDRIGLTVLLKLVHDLLHIAYQIGHVQSLRGEIAETTAVMTTSGSN